MWQKLAKVKTGQLEVTLRWILILRFQCRTSRQIATLQQHDQVNYQQIYQAHQKLGVNGPHS